jgi:hypothetical protein
MLRMKQDIYTKAVLTVIAFMLMVIAYQLNISLKSPTLNQEQKASLNTETPKIASNEAPFAAVQYVGNGGSVSFFDTRTGEIWDYGSMSSWDDVGLKRRLVKLGQPLVREK